MYRKTQCRISGKLVLLLFAATNVVYGFMLLYSIPAVMHYSDGLPLFDMSPSGYHYQDAMALLTSLGEQGRHLYLSLRLVIISSVLTVAKSLLTLVYFTGLLGGLCVLAPRWLFARFGKTES